MKTKIERLKNKKLKINIILFAMTKNIFNHIFLSIFLVN